MNFFRTKFLWTLSLDSLNPISRALPENFLSESEFPTQKLFWKIPMERWTLFQQTLRHDLLSRSPKTFDQNRKNFFHFIFFGRIFFSNVANDTIQVILWKLQMVFFSESGENHSWRQILKVFPWPVEVSFNNLAEDCSIEIWKFFAQSPKIYYTKSEK